MDGKTHFFFDNFQVRRKSLKAASPKAATTQAKAPTVGDPKNLKKFSAQLQKKFMISGSKKWGTANPTGGQSTHPPTSGGFPPQKANTYVHPEVPTGVLTQP